MFNLPISVKALTASVVAVAINYLQNLLHVSASDSVKGLIAGAIGLGIAWVVPEGAKYVNHWLNDHSIPASIVVEDGETVVRKHTP